jgi:protein O-mannosyl-transferase
VKKLLAMLLLAAAVLGVYAPGLRNGFVWDDTALVMRDPLIRSWRLIPEGFQHFLFTDATASNFYRPVQRLSYTFDYAAWGFWTGGYHLTSIVCHFLAALAVWLFATELLRMFGASETRQRVISFAAAFVWAIHPLHNAAVAYVSGRADPLAAMFGFAGLWLALVSLRSTGARLWVLTGLAGVALLLSGLSKEAGLMFLPVWLAILFYKADRKALIRAGVVVAFVCVSYGSLRAPAHHNPPPELSDPAPALARPIIAARAFAEYTGLVFAPVRLRMERDVESHPWGTTRESITYSAWRELQTVAGVLLLALFIYWMLRERRRDALVFLCLALTLLTYVPVSGVFPLNASAAEHWLYVPTAFLFLAFAAVVARLFTGRLALQPAVRFASATLIVLWAAFLGGRTFVRTFDWRDQRTFFERTLAHGGDSARTLINLASVALQENRLDDAKAHLQAALQKQPDQPIAVLNLGTVASKQGDFATAREFLNRAKEMPLVAAQAEEALVILKHKETGEVDVRRLRLATRTGMPNWSIEKRYIKVLHDIGATDHAIAEVQKCLTTAWYRAETWQLLSELFAAAGKSQAAAAALDVARRYDTRLDERNSHAL